jgi:uncharacterized protein YjbJ (UPF0337 family)
MREWHRKSVNGIGRQRVADDWDHRKEEPVMGETDGKIDQAKGRLKEAAGDLSGDRKLKDEGRVDRGAGNVQEKVGRAADKLKQAVNPDR